MKRLFFLLKATLMGALAISAMAPWLATAATGPWSWHDISDQLTEKNNRPVWAVAHSNDGWFYTDGQNLWNGGQVYRYDGSTQVNITNDVRSAGIDRVDDIVSDNAGTVLFLQDVVRLDNSLRAIAYRNGAYSNITSNVRSILASDEGVSKISGRNDEWRILTTKGRLLSFNASTKTVQVISLPSSLKRLIDQEMLTSAYRARALYEPKNANAAAPFNIQPISGSQWLLRVAYNEHRNCSDGSCETTYYHKWYRISASNDFSEVTEALPRDHHAEMLASNNDTVLILTSDLHTAHVYTYNGNSITGTMSFPGDAWPTTGVAWNGTSWMLIEQNKTLYRITNGSVESYGKTRDYFTSVAGDTNGNFLLGGAASEQNMSDPSNPLTAKLIKVIEDGGTSEGTTSNGTTVTSGGTFGGDRVFTSANGPRVTIQGNPSGFRVKNGGEFAYRATASDPNGVDRIDLYVNDARIQTCKADTCEYRTTYYLKNATTRTVKFWVRATDANGNSTDTSGNPDVLTVDANSNATADGSITNTSTNSTQSNTGNGINTWDWLNPNVSSFNGGDSVAYNVGAYDANGISQIQIIANGSVKQTCNLNNATGNVQCSATLYANDYGANTNVFVNAKVVDGNGNVAWTTGKNIARNSTVGTSSYTGSANATISEYFTPDVTSFGSNDSVGYRVTAQDNDGISRIDLYANGAIRQTCDVGNATGNIQCSTTVYANDYGLNGNVLVNAKVTDVFGNTTWSTGRTIYRNGSSSNTSSGTSVFDQLDPNVSTLSANETTTYRVNAQDADGVNRIDIYANGNIKQTCTFGNSTGNAQCSVVIYANDYSVNSNIYVNAKVTDANGNTTWTTGKNITRNGSTGSSSGSINATVSDSLSVNVSSFGPNESATYRADAQDNDGISRIQILVNGSVKQTCDFNNDTGNVQCSATLYANDYAANANVFVNAKVTDRFGNVTWTTGRNIYRNGSSSNGSNNSSNVETSRSVWLDPNQTNLFDNSRITFNVNAQDQNGLNRIEIYSNGSVRKTCTLSGTTSNVTCSYDLFASDYSLNTDITVNAKITDSLGNVVWTESKVIRRTSNGSAGTSSDRMSSWDWLEPGVASISQNDRITYHVGAWAEAGMKDVTIFVNGNAQPACTFSYGTGNVECLKELRGADYAANATVFVNARLRNMNGHEVWTTGRSFTVTPSGSGSNSNATLSPQTNSRVNANATVSAWSNTTSYGDADAITISANASDPDGVERMELYMNGIRLKTCYGTTCSAATSLYSLYPSIQFHAVVFDAYGNYTVSPTKTINHR